MTPIQVVGVGLDGRAGLSQFVNQLIDRATLLIGSPRHLSYFPDTQATVWPLEDFKAVLENLRQWLDQEPEGTAIVLASGDPLFFGLGRLLLTELPPESLTFHPHLSAIQLAFSRLKLPWQTATLVSAHGRSTDQFAAALKRGDALIAVLTDATHTPATLAQLLLSLDLPICYQIWVCENLGSRQETVHQLTPQTTIGKSFAALNVVVLQRIASPLEPDPNLPLFGLPDSVFATFDDRPGLMTKRDIRLQVLGDLALKNHQVVWDIGAGTGSVSVEMSRLCPDSQIYAVEKTMAGITLIETNGKRLGNANLHSVYGNAPEVLAQLPNPDRVFVGGSGGHLSDLLAGCAQRLNSGGRIVLALATLEHVGKVLVWVETQQNWQSKLRQIQVQTSVTVGALTRWQPLTPITIITLEKSD